MISMELLLDGTHRYAVLEDVPRVGDEVRVSWDSYDTEGERLPDRCIVYRVVQVRWLIHFDKQAKYIYPDRQQVQVHLERLPGQPEIRLGDQPNWRKNE